MDTNTSENMPHASDSGGECGDSIWLDFEKKIATSKVKTTPLSESLIELKNLNEINN